jgi:hypothetical protein
MPYYVTAPVREASDIIMHLQGPELFLVHEWRVSPETRLNPVLAPMSFFFKEATFKAVPSMDYSTHMKP